MGSLPPFAETVAELFQSTAILRWRTESTTYAVATFVVKSLGVDVDFERRLHDGPWHIAFSVVRGDVDDQTNIALAFRLFNGVFQAVREFMESREPEMLVFTASDEDVARIFETYLRRDRNTMEDLGYELMGPDRVGQNSEWSVRRVKPFGFRE